jgi:hypothetical protein
METKLLMKRKWQMANLISDYYNLAKEIIKLANDNNISKTDIEKIMNKPAKSTKRTGENRIYSDLLYNQFDMTKVTRIERCPDADDQFLKSEACYEATGTCHGNLNLLASGTTVIPIVTDAAGHSGFDELTLTQTSSRNKCGESALL